MITYGQVLLQKLWDWVASMFFGTSTRSSYIRIQLPYMFGKALRA